MSGIDAELDDIEARHTYTGSSTPKDWNRLMALARQTASIDAAARAAERETIRRELPGDAITDTLLIRPAELAKLKEVWQSEAAAAERETIRQLATDHGVTVKCYCHVASDGGNNFQLGAPPNPVPPRRSTRKAVRGHLAGPGTDGGTT